jgi:transcription initiation factor TFIIIB Brf1 subunit/transcription initiation factor TFIIB
MTRAHVEGHAGIMKDLQNGAIISIGADLASAKRAKEQRLKAKENTERLNTLETEVSEIKSKLDMILELLRKKS